MGSDGDCAARCDHWLGSFNRISHQRCLAGEIEIPGVGCDLWRDGDCAECCCARADARTLAHTNEYRLRSLVRGMRGAELGITVQDWE